MTSILKGVVADRAHVGRRKAGRPVDWVVVALCWIVFLSTVPWVPVAADSPGQVSSSIRSEGGGGLRTYQTGCGGQVFPAVNAAYEQQVVERVNAERAARNLPPLKLSAGLRDAARYHAVDMAQDSYFEHDSYDRVAGQLERVCSTWARIDAYYSSAWGENIAAGYPSPESVIAGWMGSPGHRDNLLNPNHREIGVGYAQGGSWGHYWVQDFGSTSGVYPLVINRETASTDSTHVSLYIYGDWDQVRLRNDGGTWSNWRSFANTLDWTLPARAGLHLVEAEMRAGARTATSSDRISLTAAPVAIGGLPAEMHFLYSQAEGRLLPRAALVTPLNVGNGDSFTWWAEVTGGYFEGSSLSGTEGDSFQIAPTGLEQAPVGTYRGTVIVMAKGADGTKSSTQEIALVLRVTDGAFSRVYLPTLIRR